MVLWFARGLRRGVVTTRYPLAGPDPWTAGLPTPPIFDPRALTEERADLLVAVCPSGALRRENRTDDEGEGALVYDIGACTACGRCQALAPDAVHASGEFALTATVRDHLVKRIPLRGAPS